MLRYEGTVRGFREALRELRKQAMRERGTLTPATAEKVRRAWQRVMVKDMIRQILSGPGPKAAA